MANLTTRERIMQRVQQARSPAPRASVAASQARITEAAVVPGGWFGGWLGVVDYWNRPGGGGSGPMWGVTDGSDVAPGEVGEFLRLEVVTDFPAGSNRQPSVPGVLPPGDWDVYGWVNSSVAFDSVWFQLDPLPTGFRDLMMGGAGGGVAELQTMIMPTVRALTNVPTLVVFTTLTDAPTAGALFVVVEARRRR